MSVSKKVAITVASLIAASSAQATETESKSAKQSVNTSERDAIARKAKESKDRPRSGNS